MRIRIMIVGVGLVFANGCALPTRTATLEREQRRLEAEVATLRAKVEALDAKVTGLDKRVTKIGNGKAARRNLDDRLTPIEERLGVIEQDRGVDARQSDATPLPPPHRAAESKTSPGTVSAAPELDVEALRRESSRQLPGGYERGLRFISDGAYEAAIQALRDFVRSKHGSPFVAGAYFWIGQSHAQLGQPYQAILAFTEVQQRHPRSDYAPAAGLANGMGFLALANVTEARRSFEKVVREYPDAPEAAKAAARLQALESPAR